MTKHDVIYLQTDKESELFYDEGVTWCMDKINDTGDYNDEIEAGLKAICDGFAEKGAY